MRERQSTLLERPDLIALWAFAIAVLVLVAAAVSAHAGPSGGVAPDASGSANAGAPEAAGECRSGIDFGSRPLKPGDCGDDVRTLNWLLKSKPVAAHTLKLNGRFATGTAKSVRRFQRRRGLQMTGVLRKQTRNRLIASMWRQRATWYGPGLFGNRTACGQRLRRATRGVAHRTLPCGTKVVLRHRGRTVRTTVIDRGPFAHRAHWDLTQRVARELGFDGAHRIRVAAIR